MSIRPISKELQALAIAEINEDPNRTQEDIKHIREWIVKQPHLNPRTDDQFLLAFLRGGKFSLERTKEKLDMYFTLKTITSELYDNRDPFDPEIQKALSLGIMLPLPKSTEPTAPLYWFARNGLMEKHKISTATMFKVGGMIQDILLMEEDIPQIVGSVMLQDMSGLTISYFLSLSPSLVKKAMTCFQLGYPARAKGAHFFNITPIFEKINMLFKPFLTEKLKQRMRIHSNLDELYKFVPKEVLPREYGGNNGSIEDTVVYWKKKIESYRDWFIEDAKYRNNEKRRPGKPKTSESVFGIDGSFRQLAVD